MSLLAGTVFALALAGSPPPEPTAPFVPDIEILALDQEMIDFLAEHLRPRMDPRVRVQELLEAILGHQGVDLDYEQAGTRTAIETFRTGRGNCLSFTILFVAMARQLNIDAYFLEVNGLLSWNQRGATLLRNQHMMAGIDVGNARYRIDFLPETAKSYRLVQRIGDDRALAHFYNNLGVEALAAGDLRLALARFEKALAADASFGYARTNMGVAYRRLGQLDLAERCHRQAMEAEESATTAATNLASLYLAVGRRDEAEPLLQRIDKDLEKNPFHHFMLGRAALQEGDGRSAIGHFEEAIRRMTDEPEFRAAIATAFELLGERRKARKNLERAMAMATDAGQRARFERQLAELEETPEATGG